MNRRQSLDKGILSPPGPFLTPSQSPSIQHSPRLQPSPSPFQQQDVLIVTNNQHYINTFNATQEQDRKTGTPNRRLSLNHISPNAGTIVYGRPSPTQSPAGTEFNTTLVGSNNISLNKGGKRTPNTVQQYGIATTNACSPKAAKKTTGLTLVGSPLASPSASPQPVIQQFPVMNTNNSSIVFMQQPSASSHRTSIIQTSNTQQQSNFIGTATGTNSGYLKHNKTPQQILPKPSVSSSNNNPSSIASQGLISSTTTSTKQIVTQSKMAIVQQQQQQQSQQHFQSPPHQSPQIITGNESPQQQSLSQGSSILLPTTAQPLLLNQMPVLVQQNTPQGVQLILRPPSAPQLATPSLVINRPQMQQSQPQQLLRILNTNGAMQLATATAAPAFIVSSQANIIQQNLQSIKAPGGNAGQIGSLQQSQSASRHPQQLINSHILGQSVAQIQNLQLNGNLTQIQMHNGQIIQQLPAQFSQNIGGFNQIQPISATITNATFQSPPQNNPQNDNIVVSSTNSNPIQFGQQIISPVATPQPQIIQSNDQILSSPPSITFASSQSNGTLILGGENKQLHEISSPPPFSIQNTSEMININMHQQQQPTVTTKPARKPKKSKKKLAQEQQQQQQQSAVAMISPTRSNQTPSAGKIDLANVMKICGIMDDDFMDTDEQGMEQGYEGEPSNNASTNENNEITITIPSTTSDQPITFTIPSSSLDSSNMAGSAIIQSDGEKINENVPFMIRIDADGQGGSNQPFTISVPNLTTSNLTASENNDTVPKNDEINCVPSFVNSVLNSSITPTIQSQINEIQNQLMSLPSTTTSNTVLTTTTTTKGGKAPRQKKQTTKKSKKQQAIEVPTQIGNIQISQIDGTNLKSSMIESKNINNQIQIMPILDKGPLIEKQKMQVPVMQQTISHNQSENSENNSNQQQQQQQQQGNHGPSQVNINVQQNQLINVTNNLQMQVIANPQQQHHNTAQPAPAPPSSSSHHHQTSTSSSQPALTSHVNAQNIIGNIIGQNQSSSAGNIIIQGASAFNQQQPANIQVNIQNQTIANNIIHAPAQSQANQAQQPTAQNILSQLTGNLVLSLSEDGRLILRHDPNIPQDAQSQMILQTILTGALGNVSLINEPLKQQQPIVQNHSQPTTTTHHVIGANGKVQQVTTVQNKNVIITSQPQPNVQHAHQIFSNNISTIPSQAQNIVTSAVQQQQQQQTNQQQKPQAVVLPTPNIIKFVELPKIQPNQQLFSLNTLTNEITLLNPNQTTAALSPMERLLIVPSGINAEQLAQCLSQGQIHFNNIGQAPPMTDPNKIQMQVQHQQVTLKTANVQQKSVQIKKEPVDTKPPKKARGKKAKLLEEQAIAATQAQMLSQKEIKKEPVNSPPPTPKKVISAPSAAQIDTKIVRTSLASSIVTTASKNTITICPNPTMLVNSSKSAVSAKYTNSTKKNSISVIPTSSLFTNNISTVGSSKCITTVTTTKSATKNKVITTAAPPPLVSVNQAPVPRVQTIQLTSQKQQSLKNVQMQIQQLSAKLQNKNLLATLTADLDFNSVVFNKPLPVLNNIETMTDGEIYEALQRLFVEQQKILATGKIIPTLPAAAAVAPGSQQQTIRTITNSQPIFVTNQSIIAPITSTSSGGSSLYSGGNSQKVPSPIQVNSPIVKQENQLCSASTSSQPPPLVVSAPIQMQIKTEILPNSTIIPTVAPPATGSIIISPKYTTPTPAKITIDPPGKEQKICPRESKADVATTVCEVDAAALLKQKQAIAAAEALQKKKTIRSSLFKRQICVDQEGCTKPETKIDFTSKEDAVKRLIRYHCMYEEIKDEEDPKENFEFEEKSKHILASFQVMKEKFQHLLIKQSQQYAPTSELMMLDRLQVADLKDEIMTMQMELNSVLFENQQGALETSSATIKTEVISPPSCKNSQNVAGRSLPLMQEPSQILKAKQEQKLFENIKNERIKVENAEKDDRASTQEIIKLNKAVPKQVNTQSQGTSSAKLSNEIEDFDIETEIQSNFIMKKCEPSASPSNANLSQTSVKKSMQGKEREFSPLSDYLNTVKMELLPSKLNKTHESIKGEIHESTYDEWISLQKELNLELEKPKELEDQAKKLSPKTLEPDLSDIFSHHSSPKSVEKQLDDLFSSTSSKSNDLTTASPSGLNELFNVDKTVENRLEALFGQDDVKGMQQDVESRLEQLFQGSVNSNDESALDNASFLYKSPDLTYDIIQKQVNSNSNSNASNINTNKRQWNSSGTSCDIFSSTGSSNLFPSSPSTSSSKRACTASSVTFDDNKWIDDSFDFGSDINMQTETSNDGLTKHREWSNRNIAPTLHHESIMTTSQQFSTSLHANMQSNASINQRHSQTNSHLMDTSQIPPLNYEEEDADDISRQVQNAIDSILNLQSSDPLHYQLDSSFLELNAITSSSPNSPMIPVQNNPSSYSTQVNQANQFSTQNTKVVAGIGSINKQKKYSRIEDIGDCLIGGGNLDDSPSALSLGLSDSHGEGSSASVGEFVSNLLNCDEKSISTS